LNGGNGTVKRKIIISVTAFGLAGLAAANVAQAFNFGNMMNPSRWFDNDRYDRGYYRGYSPYYGGYGPYGYGGYGGPWGGWGGYPGYGGWGGYPGYGGYGGYGGAPSTIVVNPTQGSSNEAAAPPRVPE
jgi:hypothetical protein